MEHSEDPSHPWPPPPTPPCPTVLLPTQSWVSDEVSTWQAGDLLLDDFQVECLLGQGGMGTVYLVQQRSTKQRLVVKRARFRQPEFRRRFLSELQTWIDLPSHPHLSPCRFFRTIEDEVVIFTDHAQGGSLADWISQGRLTSQEQIPVILDIAIQVAWGLHALHEHGLIHRDVKPGNVLMSVEGIAQVADFGLARARARLVQPSETGQEQTVQVTSGGLSPGYCSPEQAGGRPLSRKTDVWSWGICLLEMFVGKVPCCQQGGQHARRQFERWKQSLVATSQAHLLAGVAEVLRPCFHEEPNQRWPHLAGAADALIQIYKEVTGQDYPRTPGNTPPPLVFSPHEERSRIPHDRHGLIGMRWDSPRDWLCRAYQAAGKDPTEVEQILPPPADTRKAQAVADVTGYEQAREMIEDLLARGRAELRSQLAGLLIHKAFAHAAGGDWPGAREWIDQSLAHWEQLIDKEGRRELINKLARCWIHKGNLLRIQGDHRGAIDCYERVVALGEQLVNRRRRREFQDVLATALLHKGDAVRNLGDRKQASQLYDEASTIWQQLVQHDKQSIHAHDLARAYLNKASVLASLGDPAQGLGLCDQAIRIHRRLIQLQDRRDLRSELARAYLIKANVLRAAGQINSALPQIDKALDLWERLVQQEGRDDLTAELARTYLTRGNTLRTLGQAEQAGEWCVRAVQLLEQLLFQDGQSELSYELARAYTHLGNALRQTQQVAAALPVYDQAITLWQRLIHEEGREELLGDLARAWANKAQALRQTGDPQQALDLFTQTIDLRRRQFSDSDDPGQEGELGRDLMGQAQALHDLGLHQQARATLSEAITHLETSANSTGRRDLQSALRRAQRLARSHDWSGT